MVGINIRLTIPVAPRRFNNLPIIGFSFLNVDLKTNTINVNKIFPLATHMRSLSINNVWISVGTNLNK